jgi:hypothetical protein
MDYSWTPSERWDIHYTLKAPPNSVGNFGEVMALDLNTRKRRRPIKSRAPESGASPELARVVLFKGFSNHVRLCSVAGKTRCSQRLADPHSWQEMSGIRPSQLAAVALLMSPFNRTHRRSKLRAARRRLGIQALVANHWFTLRISTEIKLPIELGCPFAPRSM